MNKRWIHFSRQTLGAECSFGVGLPALSDNADSEWMHLPDVLNSGEVLASYD